MPSPKPSNHLSDLRPPVIVWVDDNPPNNVEPVAYARSRGVTVVELLSTASAKAWIEANQGIHDPASSRHGKLTDL